MQKILELSSALRNMMMFLVLLHTINVCSLSDNHLSSLTNCYISSYNLQSIVLFQQMGTRQKEVPEFKPWFLMLP